MRKWGVIVSACYVLIVVGLLVPGLVYIVGWRSWHEYLRGVADIYQAWVLYLPIAIVVFGQSLLLFV